MTEGLHISFMNSNKDTGFTLQLHSKMLSSPLKYWYLGHFYMNFCSRTSKELATGSSPLLKQSLHLKVSMVQLFSLSNSDLNLSIQHLWAQVISSQVVAYTAWSNQLCQQRLRLTQLKLDTSLLSRLLTCFREDKTKPPSWDQQQQKFEPLLPVWVAYTLND